jgi:hypothetical protein
MDVAMTEQTGENVEIGSAVISREYATELVGRVLWKQTDTVRTLPQRDEVAEAVVRWLVALSSDDEYAAAVMAADNGRTGER